MRIIDDYNLRDRGDVDIGIEIEMEGLRLPDNPPKWWRISYDGSLRGHAKEYILLNPCHRKRTKKRLDELRKSFEKNGSELKPSDRCGVHIHVNCQKMTNEEVMNFSIVYLILENILVKWCGETREGNLFCLRASDAEYIIKALVEAKEYGNFKNMQKNDFRYASLNFSSLSKYGSLEFRAMPAEKDFKRIQLWIEMLLAIKDYSLRFQNLFGIIEDISFNGGRRFVKMVLGESLFKKVQCNNINREVLEGVRRIQQVIYTVKGPIKKKKFISDSEGPFMPNMNYVRRRMPMQLEEVMRDVPVPRQPEEPRR